MSTIVKADADGQVILSADLCRRAGVGPQSELLAEVQNGRIVLEPAALSLAERIVARAQRLPPEAVDALPEDLATQHGHYLYGTPKRPE